MQTKERYSQLEDNLLVTLRGKGVGYEEIVKLMPGRKIDGLRSRYYSLRKDEKLRQESNRILTYDIEVSLMDFKAFRTGEQFLGADNIENDFFILSYAAKWMNSDEVYSDIVTPVEARKRNDKRILQGLWKLMDEADILVGHNNISYDNKMCNTRFLYHRLGLPRDYKSRDTLKEIRKICRMSSNKLDYALNYFGLGGKVEHYGLQMWKDCEKGNQEALDLMLKYNKGDVIELEKLYLLLKQGMKPLKIRVSKAE